MNLTKFKDVDAYETPDIDEVAVEYITAAEILEAAGIIVSPKQLFAWYLPRTETLEAAENFTRYAGYGDPAGGSLAYHLAAIYHSTRTVCQTTLEFPHMEIDVALTRDTYRTSGGLAIVGTCIPTGEPAFTASVNIPGFITPPGHFLVKDYSGSEGMLDWLLSLGFVEPTGRLATSGFIVAPEVKLLVELTEFDEVSEKGTAADAAIAKAWEAIHARR